MPCKDIWLVLGGIARSGKRVADHIERYAFRLILDVDGLVDARRAAEGLAHFFRESGTLPYTSKGDQNTYGLFAELCRRLRRATGRVGIIVPTGLVADMSYADFFAALVDAQELLDGAAQVGIARAGMVEKGRAVVRSQLECGLEELVDFAPAIGVHGEAARL